MIVVSLKYVVLIMRADNKGEGGIMAMIALAQQAIRQQPQWKIPLLLIGIFGASLFYGDAVITPAVTVLSAVEGLEVGTSASALRRADHGRGAARALRLPGARHCRGRPPVRAGHHALVHRHRRRRHLRHRSGAADPEGAQPLAALQFLSSHGFASFVVLGSVVLAVTGAEALYADMGHFGKAPGAHRLVQPRRAGTGAELLRPGRSAPRQSGGGDEPVLPPPSRLGALSDVALATLAGVMPRRR
jgi:KUP system potassium uptake protein